MLPQLVLLASASAALHVGRQCPAAPAGEAAPALPDDLGFVELDGGGGQTTRLDLLDSETFAAATVAPRLVFFVLPWCGTCLRHAPLVVQVTNTLRAAGGIDTALVDCNAEFELCMRQRITSVPAAAYYDGRVRFEYTGAFRVGAVLDFVDGLHGHAVARGVPAPDEHGQDGASSSRKMVVGAFATADSTAFGEFARTASLLRLGAAFYAEVDPSLPASVATAMAGAPDETGYVYLDAEGTCELLARDVFSVGAIARALVTDGPAVYELGRQNYVHALHLDVPAVMVFADLEDAGLAAFVRDRLTAAAAVLGDAFNWVYVDQGEYGALAERLQLPCADARVCAALVEFDNGRHRVLDFDALEDSLAHRDELPVVRRSSGGGGGGDGGDDPVQELSGPALDQALQGARRSNLLVLFYAPWCAFAANAYAVFDQAARLAVGVDFARIDVTKNDIVVPADIRSVPDIRLFPAGNQTDAVPFQGARNPRELAAFARKEYTHRL